MIKPSIRDREAGRATLYFFFGLPWSIILHELGHYYSAVALGHKAILSYAAVHIWFEIAETNSRDLLLTTLAGPILNLLLAIIGVIGLRALAKKTELTKVNWRWVWVFSICSLSGLRGISKIAPSSGPESDEAHILKHLEIGTVPGILILALPSLFFLAVLLHFHFRKKSLTTFFLGMLCGCCGVLLWFKVIGPAFLPDPS